tara:strand:+ start:7133 stop:7357 length:225 start_codon:yes stop_codon:yes gene_type:complete
MELIDTPNPNAKKILIDKSFSNEDSKHRVLEENLKSLKGISSVFFGPGFLTILKDEDIKWESITEDITIIFDKL